MLRFTRVYLATLFSVLALLAWPSAASAGLASEAAKGWAVEPPPSWVVPVEPAAPTSGSEAANGGRNLLLDRQLRVGSKVETYVRSVRQITNEAGLSASSQVSIDFDPTWETLAIHSVKVRRGTETFDRLDAAAIKLVQRERNLEAQIFDGRQSAVLFVNDLRVGDVVDTAFTMRAVDPTAAGHFTDAVGLGASEPIARLHARLLVTDRRDLRLRIHSPDGDRTPFAAPAAAVEGGVAYEWRFDDVKAYPVDPMTPTWHSPSPWVQLTDFASWREVSSWAARLFDVPTPTSGPVRDWAVTTKKASSSEDEYLLRAIRFVQDEIRYVAIETGISRRRPNAPADVFERRYGDCKDKAALLVALLRLGGIAAEPALVSTTHHHVLEELAPSSSVFDHVIVRVGARSGRVHWVDATMTLQGGGLAAFDGAPYEHALPVGEPASGLVDLTPPSPARSPTSVHDHYAVTAPDAVSGETLLDSERVYEGHVADGMRAQLRSKTSDEITKSFLAMYQPDFAAIHEVRPLEREDDRERNVLRLVLHFGIPLSGLSTRKRRSTRPRSRRARSKRR